MKNYFIIILLFISKFVIAQQILLNSSSGNIYSFDPLLCELTFEYKIDANDVVDIALTPDETLYFVDLLGELRKKNSTNNESSLVFDFETSSIVGLTSDENGMLYVAHYNGIIEIIDPTNPIPEEIADINLSIDGDILVYNNNMFIADNGIHSIPLSDLSNPDPKTTITTSDDEIFYGIFMFPSDCFDTHIYGISQYGKELMKFNIESGVYDVVCDINFSFWGAASSYEFHWKPLTDISLTADHPSCGNADGMIIIDTSTFTETYEYSIDGETYQSIPSFENLTVGSYTISAKNSNGCIKEFEIDLMNDEAPKIEHITTISNNCGYANGSLQVDQISIPNSIVEYSLDGTNYSSSPIFENLSEGNYTIYLRDENGCIHLSKIDLFSISPSIELLDTDKSICANANGKAYMSSSDALNPQYSSDGINYGSSNVIDNLEPGIHIIYLQDGTNCIDSIEIDIETFELPEITKTNILSTTCNQENGKIEINEASGIEPLEFSIDGSNYGSDQEFTNLASGAYNIYIQDPTGCIIEIEKFVPAKPHPQMTPSSKPEHCGENNGIILSGTIGGENNVYSLDGINFQENGQFENLSQGEYTIYLLDDNNCTDTTAINIDSFPAPIITNIEIQAASCAEFNGSILIEALEGFGTLRYSVSNISFFDTGFFENLRPGTFPIVIRDELGCEATDEVQIEDIPIPSITSLLTTDPNCGEEGSVEITMNESEMNYQFIINDEAFPEGFISDLVVGEYDLEIIDDFDCSISTMFSIVAKDCDLYIPNIFSPDNNGINDLFTIKHHQNLNGKILNFQIFDRWGNQVFSVQNIDFQDVQWSGNYKGKRLQQGVYVYYLEYEQDGKVQEIQKGDITIIR